MGTPVRDDLFENVTIPYTKVGEYLTEFGRQVLEETVKSKVKEMIVDVKIENKED